MFGIFDTIKLGAGAAAGAFLTWSAMSTYDRFIDDPAVAAAAREGYVQLAERTALEATVSELTRQRNASDAAMRAALARAETAKQEATRAQAEYENLVAQDRGDDGARVDGSDLRWLHDN